MNELSLFVDESGSDGLASTYYLLTLVLHNQSDNILESVKQYEEALREKRLPNIPFHASPLLNGKDSYRDLPLAERKKMLGTFRVFFRHAPIRYKTFAFKTKEHRSVESISEAMHRELLAFLSNNLGYFQQFDQIKLYYDNGQRSIANALHRALDQTTSRSALIYRISSPESYRLAQVADYICTIELTALKYQNRITTATDEKFGYVKLLVDCC